MPPGTVQGSMPGSPMPQPTSKRRALLACGAALCAALAIPAAAIMAAAQDEPPPADAQQVITPALQPGQEQLRERLADPEQRTQIRAERLQYLREARPDLAVVLGLNAGTEQQLFEVLADHQLALELQPRVDPRTLPVAERAQEYTRRMRDIGRVLGEDKLTAYVDYMQTLFQRYHVRELDRELPAHAKLGAAQKEGLIGVFYELSLREALPTQPYPEPTSKVQQGLQLEARLLSTERFFLEGVIRTGSMLTSEQNRALAKRNRIIANQLQEAIAGEHKSHGAVPDEILPATEPSVLTDDARLRIEIDVNGSKRIETLSSTGGTALWFEAPAGLRVQAQAYLLRPGVVMLELSLFEPGRNTQRLLGRSYRSNSIDSTDPSAALGASERSDLFEGLQGYGVIWDFSATYE